MPTMIDSPYLLLFSTTMMVACAFMAGYYFRKGEERGKRYTDKTGSSTGIKR